MSEEDNDGDMETSIKLVRDSVAALLDGIVDETEPDAIRISLGVYETFQGGDKAYCDRFHRFLATDASELDPWMKPETRARCLAHADVPKLCFRTCALFMCAATFLSYRERYDGFYHSFYLPPWVVRAALYGGSEYDASKLLVERFNCGIEIKHGKTCCIC